ncbi:MAG: hypothetical protein DYG94_10475 [Leptolyngbya sp. PLA3]|nr:MAG: hypothetical protein EDM82_09890 [Cyanobacteria bacterium CYA]MCE7969156.1 hypothetical protein [Leptolyngbya sp. PL-A3]
MSGRDFYEILGVKRSATADEIKRAYRKLARQLHPDVNKAPDAAQRFAEVQEAYDVLSDEERRKQYDTFGRAGVGGPAGRAGAAGGPAGAGPWPGGVRFETEMGDLGDLGSVFDAFFGRGAAGPKRSARAHRAPRKGRDVHGQIDIDLETVASGGRRSLRVVDGDRERTIEVTVPPGISSGQTLRLRGEGEPGPGGERGDLLVEVKVREHPLFHRGHPGHPSDSSLDLFFDLPLTVWEAMQGACVDVPTLDGTVQLTIPGGTSSGRSLRLKARGLKGRSGQRGDLYAVVQIVVPRPDDLGEAERRAIEHASRLGPEVRKGPQWKR